MHACREIIAVVADTQGVMPWPAPLPTAKRPPLLALWADRRRLMVSRLFLALNRQPVSGVLPLLSVRGPVIRPISATLILEIAIAIALHSHPDGVENPVLMDAQALAPVPQPARLKPFRWSTDVLL